MFYLLNLFYCAHGFALPKGRELMLVLLRENAN